MRFQKQSIFIVLFVILLLMMLLVSRPCSTEDRIINECGVVCGMRVGM